MIQNTEYGPRFTEEERQELPRPNSMEVREGIPKHTSKGKYGPIINYLFGEKIEENTDPRLRPVIDAIQNNMRGKSGFIELDNNIFYKNGSMIEAVLDPNMIPEGVSIKNLSKLMESGAKARASQQEHPGNTNNLPPR